MADNQSSKVFLDFALFCNEAVVGVENFVDGKEVTIRNKLAQQVIQNLVIAMNRGSLVARQRFPRLLQLIDFDPSVGNTFVDCISQVPTWTILIWKSQITGLLNEGRAVYLIDILQRMSQDYPQAMYYPINMSVESLTPTAYKRIEHLKNMLDESCSHIKLFISALNKLTHPEHRFKDSMDTILALLPAGSEEFDTERVLNLWQNLKTDCLDIADNHGAYNVRFAKMWNKIVIKNYGADGEKLISMGKNRATTIMNEIFSKMRSDKLFNRMTSKPKLSQFSKYLNDFDNTNTITQIEVPGQYNNLSTEPDTKNHIKISGFDGTLLVMASMRKPKRLKIRGDNEKDYPFLVKGGEDLRLDERVEQLFNVMNQIFDTSPNTKFRKQRIKTYDVIPMTSRVGIIEWVEDTMPIKGLIESVIAKDKEVQKVSILNLEGSTIHKKWLSTHAGSSSRNRNIIEQYGDMFINATRESCQIKLRKQHAVVEWDVLRRGIYSLASNPEVFLNLRTMFIKTLATFNIGSYIIGIGDRHLDNFLIDLKTAGVVGIDFGHAFGSATQFLPIPELMPFRLTRQFDALLRPIGLYSLRNYMIHALEALHNRRDILLATMDVFVHEPLLEWERFGRKLAAKQGLSKYSSKWFPKKKISIAKKKLEKYNPRVISLKEFKESIHAGRSYYNAVVKIINGKEKYNKRARVGDICSSVAKQVDCLIDQATDPNILARAWAGWVPYM